MILPDWISRSEKVLVAPLNWGLGHATRCIPIINKLLEMGKEVFIASDGESFQLLHKEYPRITSFQLSGYNIEYKYLSIAANILRHSIDILSAIKNEKKEIEEIVINHNIDTIISDNRYGARYDLCKSVIICHQINIKDGNTLASALGSKINQYWIKQFDECWIPDFEQPNSMAGELSVPNKLNQFNYIGHLSRLEQIETERERDIMVILSGPEPKRTQLERKLIPLLEGIDFLMIRGVVDDNINDNQQLKNYLTAQDLNREICASGLIICRSGYSSIMDLIKLDKKAIIIPTPGQGEQEYLAYLHSHQSPSQFKMLNEKDLNKITSVIESFNL